MRRYLVTGGAGFIGSHIVDALVGRGESVRVLDNFSSGRRENLVHNLDRIQLIEGDLTDLDTVRHAVSGVDYVLHLGAISSVPRSVADPLAAHTVNATGTLHVLMAAREAGVRRVVYSSSSAVYGNDPALPKHEDMLPQPLSPYAVSKLAAEHYCTAFHQVFGLPTVSLRYFNVFGPRQDPTSEYAAVIPKFIIAMLRGQSPAIYGDGLQSRDFIYVANVVTANLLACESERAVGQVMNIASGERVTLRDLVVDLNTILETHAQPRFEAARPGDVRHSQADISRVRSVLGLAEISDFNQGLRKTVDWFRTV